jgi:hypothetical protein
MDKAYDRTIWENQPSTNTALGATNLNKMDYAINVHDDRIIAMDTSKANQSTVNNTVQSITYNESTGVLTITKVNGTSTNIDTKLEKLAVNFLYNPETQQLDITLDDGTVQHVDMSSLVTQYEFQDTDTVSFLVESDGTIKANIILGSITGEYLQPDYLADIIVQTNIATTQAGISTAAAESAANSAAIAAEYSSIVYPNLYIDTSTGELMSVGGENITFSIDSSGNLISEVTI